MKISVYMCFGFLFSNIQLVLQYLNYFLSYEENNEA